MSSTVSPSYELVMYTRTFGCPYVDLAVRFLTEHQVPYREVFIDRDPEARLRVERWTGFRSVPTLIVAEPGSLTPVTPPLPLEPGHSPRGIDRGSMLTEPSERQLADWLRRHGLLAQPESQG